MVQSFAGELHSGTLLLQDVLHVITRCQGTYAWWNGMRCQVA